MNNITEIERESVNGELIKYVIIDRGNNEFTSMPKTVYDAQQEGRI
jgi:hypothetical protein